MKSKRKRKGKNNSSNIERIRRIEGGGRPVYHPLFKDLVVFRRGQLFNEAIKKM